MQSWIIGSLPNPGAIDYLWLSSAFKAAFWALSLSAPSSLAFLPLSPVSPVKTHVIVLNWSLDSSHSEWARFKMLNTVTPAKTRSPLPTYNSLLSCQKLRWTVSGSPSSALYSSVGFFPWDRGDSGASGAPGKKEMSLHWYSTPRAPHQIC